MRVVASSIAIVLLLVVTLLSAVRFAAPWTASVLTQHVMPMLHLVVIVVCALRRQMILLPSVLVFACGIIMDLASQEALGHWTSLYLVTSGVAHWMVDRLQPDVTGRCFIPAASSKLPFLVHISLCTNLLFMPLYLINLA